MQCGVSKHVTNCQVHRRKHVICQLDRFIAEEISTKVPLNAVMAL